MILDLKQVPNIFVICGKTDLRKGIDGLATLVTEEYGMDPFDQSLFLFCGSQPNRFKALYWDTTGFILLYKRFENGKLQWPNNKDEIKQLTFDQVDRLLSGLAIIEKRTVAPAKVGSFY
ncbi:MAG: IS66 family insertion sequence element accessory protein TnpB [Streptococcaceae bacterium]|jgi:transposase|nr:IS66 family insertion sequence element accessory protein TnpB [Streptococcaceae bacterium]